MIPVRAFEGKTVAVFGLARTGLAAARALVAGGAEVALWDEKPASRAAAEAAGFALTDLSKADWSQFAALMLSPGVPLTHPAPHWTVERAKAAGVEILGDMELFARAVNAAPEHKRPKIVAITGTNGKSTTTALIHHIVETAGIPARLGGNIGLPILGEKPLQAGGIYVLELSSYQLDLTFTLDCDVAVLLNLTPDHLDRYDGFEGYAAAKARLFAMQSPSHDAVIGIGDEASAAIARSLSSRGEHLHKIAPGVCLDQSRWPSLQGPHNAQNALAAITACQALGIPEAAIDAGLESYKGLPHRMEWVGVVDGVTYVNDSKATNPDSTAPALAAFERIHWILGGRAKIDNLDACRPSFSHVRAAYTIGEAGMLFRDLLQDVIPTTYVGTLPDAIDLAHAAAEPGDTVLLSPACASFDQFRDYEDRGDTFRGLVEALT